MDAYYTISLNSTGSSYSAGFGILLDTIRVSPIDTPASISGKAQFALVWTRSSTGMTQLKYCTVGNSIIGSSESMLDLYESYYVTHTDQRESMHGGVIFGWPNV